VHDALSSIEAEAERMYASERGLMDADSQSRDRLYQRAQQVGTPVAELLLIVVPTCRYFTDSMCGPRMLDMLDRVLYLCLLDFFDEDSERVVMVLL
jgi:hypothetical protein